MTKITLSTCDAHFEETAGRGYTVECASFGIGEPEQFPRQTIECTTLASVSAAVEAYGAAAMQAAPSRSFIVVIIVARGSRKMAGFDAAYRSKPYLGTKQWMQTIVKPARAA